MSVPLCAAGCGNPGPCRRQIGKLTIQVCPDHMDCPVQFGAGGLVFDCEQQQIRQAETERLAAAARERAAKKQRRETRAAQRH